MGMVVCLLQDEADRGPDICAVTVANDRDLILDLVAGDTPQTGAFASPLVDLAGDAQSDVGRVAPS
jgi:hypothetical protein